MIHQPEKTGPFAAPDDCPAMRWAALVTLTTVTSRRLRASLAGQIAEHGLGESEFALLWACYRPASQRLETEGLTQIELAQTLELSPASVSGLVEELRRAGLLAGARSTVDRRRQVWHLTDAGQALVGRLLAELAGWSASLDRVCDRAEQRALTETLAQILAVANSQQGDRASSGEGRRGVAA